MTTSGGAVLRMFGERTPLAFALFLLVTGVALGLWDATLWKSALTSPAAPLVVPEPMRSTPVVPAPIVVPLPPPAVEPPAPAVAPTLEAQDCPPLFPVMFDLGSAAPQFEETALATLVEWLVAHPDTTLVVDGHSDSVGSAAVNLALSQRRAGQMVKRFLAANLPRDRITRRAFGNYSPVVGAPEDAPQNRRVVLSVAGLKNCRETP